MYGEGIWEAIVSLAIIFAVAVFALGAVSAFVLPDLWEWLKPIIHSATA